MFPSVGWCFIVLQLVIVCVCSRQPGNTNVSPRIVSTRYGKLQGLVVPMDQHRFLKPVEMFLGIPYATPPVRSNRFSPTRTPSPWDGVRMTDKMGPVCPQKLPDISNETAAMERMPKGRYDYLKRLLPLLKNQSEDCLYLNVYAPSQVGIPEEKMARHPVLVFIHGESYEWNSGNPYDGSVLASYAELVVVTLNYRLGILGFLNANLAPHLKARVANYGLMDQIAALHWIQQNIALFGGDPGNVTLLGHGTGAACIHFLMTSPTVMPGLFHRAILLSGSAISSWALVEDPVTFAVRLARSTNCTIPEDLFRDHEAIVDCLRDLPLDDLLHADVTAPTYLSAFGPSVDGVVIKTDFQKELLTYFQPDLQGFTTSTHSNMKRSGEATLSALSNTYGANKYDILFGVVTSEALWRFSSADIQSGFEGERRDKIIRTYVRNAYTYHLSEIFFTVVNEYTDWERTVLHPINTRDATVQALSDAEFVAPLVQTGDLLSYKVPGTGTTKSYFYVFDYQTKDGDYPQRMGTVHGEELPYVFGAPLVETLHPHFPKNYTKSEVGLSEAVIVYFSNFIRTGNPNEHQKQEQVLQGSKEKNRFRSIVWDEYDSVHQKYLEISMKPRMKNHFRAHQLSVWLRLIPELHRAGMEDVVARHNLFKNHNEADLYDGVVRADPLSRLPSPFYEIPEPTVRSRNSTLELTTVDTQLTTCVTVINSVPNFQQTNNFNHTSDTLASLEAAGYAAYSTALSVTIAIGCSLLILNVLIFAGVYYQRDKTRLEVKNLQQQQQTRNFDGIKHRYHQGSASVIVDVDDGICMNTNPGISHHNMGSPTHMNTLKKQHINSSNIMSGLCKAPPSSPMQNTLPQQQQQQQHIIRADNTVMQHNNMNHLSHLQVVNTPECVNLPPNGSIGLHLSVPRPPPPPRNKSPPEHQPLLNQHQQQHQHQQQVKPMRLPTAAMDEMRV